MEYTVTHSSTYVKKIFASGKSGYVHSVYRRTINLMVDGQLFSIQSKNSPLSPISMILDLNEEAFSELPIAKNQQVITSDSAFIIFSSGIFSFCLSDKATLFYNSFPGSSKRSIKPYLRLIHSIFSQVSPSGFLGIIMPYDNSIQDYTLKAASEHLAQASFLCQAAHWSEAANRLIRLIGLGIGLTPSGDDFLCGVMAALQCLQLSSHPFYENLSRETSSHLQDTNDISRAFLLCALQHQYSLAVCHFFQAVPETAGADFAQHAIRLQNEFSAIGHSSGMDTLCGIYYILNLYESNYFTC